MIDSPAAEAARAVARLGLSSRLPAERLAHEATWAADPGLALARVEELVDVAHALPELTSEERIALFVLLGGSAHLARVLTGDSGWAEWLRRAVRDKDEPPRLAGGDLDALAGEEPSAVARALRRWRQRAYLRIGARDLWGVASIDETLAALSDLAETAIDAATNLARRELERDYGYLLLADGRPNRFGVLGMGKLGARELNYSSDVDLIFVHEATDAPPSTRGPRGSLPPLGYFTRLAERLTRLLSEVTDDGFVFRVDLRLRPDGMNGPLTSSLHGTLSYYESFGQTWERAALFKARPVGGDRDLAEHLLTELAPFVYRRTLDYTMIADLEQMKARVDEQVQSKGVGNRHVKLGPGGIREVEFLAQSFSLVHGGRDRRLRERATLAALRRLVEVGLLEPDEGAEFAEAYRWLRRVEHALQIDEDRQLHVLPAEPAAREIVARRLGLHLEGEGPVWKRSPGGDASERFESEHERQTARVQRGFDDLFRSRRQETIGADASARDLLDDLDQPGIETRLAELGFHDPGVAAAALRSIRDGIPKSRPESRRTVLSLAPALVQAVRESPNPDRALATLAEFLGRVGARRTTTALLAENPATLRLLVNLFASSEYLSQVLVRHPELLDTLVRSDLAVAERSASEMQRDLDALEDDAADFEQRLDVLRRFRSDEMLRIGIHDIQGELHYTKVADQLSALADTCLAKAYAIALAERVERYGAPPGLGLAVVALGKLGSQELNYHSDLDLIFVYGPSAEVAPAPEVVERFRSSGLEPHELFGKLAQLLMLVLQVGTREGIVYKIDTRLRPSGRSGLLVTSREAFARYHAESSAVWERQALVRARVVCGPSDLARDVGAIIEGFVYGRGLASVERAEIARMRRRMERELSRESARTFNLKTGRGGLVDIEFIAQAGALAYGHERPALRQRATRRLLDAMGAAGIITPEDHATLHEAYSFLRGLENRLRIEGEHAIEHIARTPAALVTAGRRMGMPGEGAEPGRRLIEEYERQSSATRGVYDRLLGRFAPPEA